MLTAIVTDTTLADEDVSGDAQSEATDEEYDERTKKRMLEGKFPETLDDVGKKLVYQRLRPTLPKQVDAVSHG